MARSLGRDQSISQKNNASCIGNRRGKARRAKRNSSKRDRQFLARDLMRQVVGFASLAVIVLGIVGATLASVSILGMAASLSCLTTAYYIACPLL